MKLNVLIMSTGIAALMAGGAIAQTATPAPNVDAPVVGAENAPIDAAPVFTSIEEMTVGDVVGRIVYDPQGERISEIDYVILPTEGPAFVLGLGGFLGLGEYTVALPAEEFQLAADGSFFTLNTDRETLENYPEIDESELEELPNDVLMSQVMVEPEPEITPAPATGGTLDTSQAPAVGTDSMNDSATDMDTADAPMVDDDSVEETAAPEAEMDEPIVPEVSK